MFVTYAICLLIFLPRLIVLSRTASLTHARTALWFDSTYTTLMFIHKFCVILRQVMISINDTYIFLLEPKKTKQLYVSGVKHQGLLQG